MKERFDLELFYEDFKKIRLEHKLSQTELAQNLGLASHTIVSKIENKKIYPSDDMYNKFCDFFNIDKSKYWNHPIKETPFAFLKGKPNGITTEDIEQLCEYIETQEHLLILKKRFYEK